ncbi:MAG: nicotinate-nucleotide adenylyltransferase [bacterium]|nr:nicotinate-nucleotide adenylyltransferase [bacterium]MDD5353704.1 nicotinate-nucleotide adenylyltransferase [bacterium]MDD5755672.1 nicotinate-nucleotide adenylyltransferase [bacterium]
MTKIGLFGGTFDPIHNGHLKIAGIVRQKLGLDKIIFIPAGILPHKAQSQATAKDRLAMVKLSLRHKKKFTVSAYETNKRSPSYSIETVWHLKRKLGRRAEFFFIIGADAFGEIRTWRRWRELLRICRFIVINRPGYQIVLPQEPVAAQVAVLRITGIPIAATAIRQKIAKNKSISKLVPKVVYAYIKKHKLYE